MEYDNTYDFTLIPNEIYVSNVSDEEEKYQFIQKVQSGIYKNLYKFKPMNQSAKNTTKEISKEDPYASDGRYAYMDSETVYYTFMDDDYMTRLRELNEEYAEYDDEDDYE